MGRLIDEQTANEAVRKVLRKYGFSDELCVSDEIWDCIENEVPTAYDVDKVVEGLKLENKRLKTLKNNCIALCDHEACAVENKAYGYAIKLVKRGGKDE